MSRFIELHLNEKDSPPVIVNTDRIVFVRQDTDNEGSYIRIGTNQDGSFTGYYVKESYSFIKRELL
jgi:hypothetical protein